MELAQNSLKYPEGFMPNVCSDFFYFQSLCLREVKAIAKLLVWIGLSESSLFANAMCTKFGVFVFSFKFDSLCPINNLSVKQGRVFLG